MERKGVKNERTVGLRFVSQMTISSYRRKIKTLKPFLDLYLASRLGRIEQEK